MSLLVADKLLFDDVMVVAVNDGVQPRGVSDEFQRIRVPSGFRAVAQMGQCNNIVCPLFAGFVDEVLGIFVKSLTHEAIERVALLVAQARNRSACGCRKA